MNRNEKIKLGLINVGVIGITIMGAYIYGEMKYINGILDVSKELNEDYKEHSKNYKRGGYKSWYKDRA